MRKLACISAVLLLLSGCFVNRPYEEFPLKTELTLQDFVGTYANRPTNPKIGIGLYDLILVDAKNRRPGDNSYEMEIISMKAAIIASGKIKISAYSNKKLVREKVFTEGDDFTIEGDKIILKNNVTAALGPEVAGVEKNYIAIHKDTKGNIVIIKEGSIVGAYGLILPAVASSYEYLQYECTSC